MESLKFYCGLTHKYWNFHLCDPGSLACISPIVGRGKYGYGINSVYVPDGTSVFLDSGAFGDPIAGSRLTFADALSRQEKHAQKYSYADRLVYLASYDFLLHHRAVVVDGRRHQRRKIEPLAESAGYAAVEETVKAARFLDQHRNGIPLALNVQGVTPQQYLACVKQVVPLLRDEDILGLGGWCVLGRLPSLMDDFLQTLDLVIPWIAKEGVKRVHLYGVIYAPALTALLAICDAYGVACSTDSSFPSYAPRLGKWGYGIWRVRDYQRPRTQLSCYDETCVPTTRCVGMECIRHVHLTRWWLLGLREYEKQMYQRYARHLDQYRFGRILDMEGDDYGSEI